MKKEMISVTFFSLIGLLAAATVYHFTANEASFSLAVTFGTTFYHLAMRLAVGLLIDRRYHNRMDYTREWFREKAFEQRLYRWMKVKRWKKWLPTFNQQYFSLKDRSVEEIIQATCQAEAVHEVIMALSFVPVLFTGRLGSLGVFLATSCIAFLFDSIFVVMQRYNRPRLLRLLRK